jgi:hypothetical protein
MQNRYQFTGIGIGFENQQRAQLRIAILFNDEYRLVLLYKTGNFSIERKSPNTQIVCMDALLA